MINFQCVQVSSHVYHTQARKLASSIAHKPPFFVFDPDRKLEFFSLHAQS